MSNAIISTCKAINKAMTTEFNHIADITKDVNFTNLDAVSNALSRVAKSCESIKNDIRNVLHDQAWENLDLRALKLLGFAPFTTKIKTAHHAMYSKIYLIPAWLFDEVPAGTHVYSATGNAMTWGTDEFDRDDRGGYLAYGILPMIGNKLEFNLRSDDTENGKTFTLFQSVMDGSTEVTNIICSSNSMELAFATLETQLKDFPGTKTMIKINVYPKSADKYDIEQQSRKLGNIAFKLMD